MDDKLLSPLVLMTEAREHIPGYKVVKKVVHLIIYEYLFDLLCVSLKIDYQLNQDCL